MKQDNEALKKALDKKAKESLKNKAKKQAKLEYNIAQYEKKRKKEFNRERRKYGLPEEPINDTSFPMALKIIIVLGIFMLVLSLIFKNADTLNTFYHSIL